jgi:hypothetical protein
VWTRERFGDSFDSRIIEQKRGGVMKFRIALLAALTMMLGDTALAQNGKTAVTPVLSGTYILQVIHFCQAAIANTQSSGVVSNNSGDWTSTVGAVDFDPNTGIVTTSGVQINGSSGIAIHQSP